jgi:hypothetical protein
LGSERWEQAYFLHRTTVVRWCERFIHTNGTGTILRLSLTAQLDFHHSISHY